MQEKRVIPVTCAILVDAGGRVLVTQRSSLMKLPLKWEFPGGKMERGEGPEECLAREIREELGLEIYIGKRLASSVHHYPDFSIELIPFICEVRSGHIVLNEHAAYLWMNADGLPGLDWAEADVPVLRHYLEFIGK